MRHRWAQPNRSSRVGPLTPVGYWPLVTLSKGPTLALRTSPRVRPFSDFEDHPNTSSMWARLLSDDVDRLKAGFLFLFFLVGSGFTFSNPGLISSAVSFGCMYDSWILL